MISAQASESEQLAPYFMLCVLLIAVGILVVGEAARFKGAALVSDRNSADKDPLHS